jgi:peptidoglycan hydrolase-like protein with peptidoglycan-binding domain
VQEGQALAEVNGRPVLVLQGDTPAFREIRAGMTGTDVKQIQAALARLGFDPHAVDGVFGPGTQKALADWYGSLGYPAVGPTKEEIETQKAAEGAVAAAVGQQSQAAAELAGAKRPPAQLELDQAELTVALAREDLDEVRAAGGDDRSAQLQLRVAKAALDQLRAPKDTAAASAAVSAADKAVRDARAAQAAVNSTIGFKVPFCEIVFVPRLPAVIDRPAANQGSPDAPDGAGSGPAAAAWLRLSGGDLVLQGEVSTGDVELLQLGMAVRFGADATAGTGRITAMTPPAGADGPVMTITPDTPFGGDALGSSLKVVIPVQSTSGEVLAVPLAAVSARADGSARLIRLGAAGEEEVVIDAGLSADGYVEVEPAPGGQLAEGDRVLVGR